MKYKTTLINLAIFLAGVATGVIVAKKVYEKYYDDLAQEEIASVKEALAKPLPLPSNLQGISNEDYERTYGETRPTNDNSLARPARVSRNPYEAAKTHYNLSSATLSSVPDEDYPEETDVGAGEEREVPETEEFEVPIYPYVITSDQFLEDSDKYDKVSLYYYSLDDVLCDEQEEVIDDIDDTVGYDALAILDMQTSVWVRNERLHIDYEILSVKQTYAEAVLGIENKPNQTPREKYEQRAKRRK